MAWEGLIVDKREEHPKASGRVPSRKKKKQTELSQQTEHGQSYLQKRGDQQGMGNGESTVGLAGAGARA